MSGQSISVKDFNSLPYESGWHGGRLPHVAVDRASRVDLRLPGPYQSVPMSSSGTKPPTLADLDALPAGVVGEIIEGVLYTMTKPRARHQLTASGISADLRAPFLLGRGGPGGWWIIAEPGIE